jgi:DnaD/phage-associated family protein
MISDDCKCPRNPIQSESNPNTNPNPEPESKRASAAADDRPDFNTVEVYATSNLAAMNGGNMEEFAAFKADIPEELIRHAIDEACAQGKRTWSYVRSILNRYRDSGFRTVGDVQKADDERRAKAKAAPASKANQGFQTRTESASEDYYKDFFYDPSIDYGSKKEGSNVR